MRNAARDIAPDIPTVCEFPEVGRELELICKSCGREGDYRVGRVVVDPIAIRPFLEGEGAIDEALSFSGIFYCKNCKAAGPWKTPSDTQTALLACLPLSASGEQGEFGVQFGAMTMFDGTISRSGAEAETYLKQKLEEEPENAFLWGRLGNLYDNADLPEQAKEAFEKSVHLDPGEPESLYSLGAYYLDNGDEQSAAEHFEAAILHARKRRQKNPPVMKKLVCACLGHLFDLFNETGGEIPFPPKLEDTDRAKPTTPEELGFGEWEFPSEEGWEALTTLYLTGRVPKRMLKRATKAQGHQAEDDGGPIREANPVGRNDPCPCGSGKKYKRCCLSSNR